MNLTPQAMAREVAATGFGAEPLETVFRLMALLDALNSHPFLKARIALKLAALVARSASRDVFDAHALLVTPGFDPVSLRLAFVVYGGINRRDWRTVSLEDVTAAPSEIQTELVPMLRPDRAPAKGEVSAWAEKLVAECRERLSLVLPLDASETEFLRCLNEEGRIVPDLITVDPELQATVREHPGLQWKALNVRGHRDLGGALGPHGSA